MEQELKDNFNSGKIFLESYFCRELEPTRTDHEECEKWKQQLHLFRGPETEWLSSWLPGTHLQSHSHQVEVKWTAYFFLSSLCSLSEFLIFEGRCAATHPVKTGTSGQWRMWQSKLYSWKDPGHSVSIFTLVRSQDLDWVLPTMSILGLQQILQQRGPFESHFRDLQITSIKIQKITSNGRAPSQTEVKSWNLAWSPPDTNWCKTGSGQPGLIWRRVSHLNKDYPVLGLITLF